MKDFKRFFNKLESIVLGLSIIGVFFLILQLGFMKNMEMPTFYEDYEYDTGKESEKNKEVGYIVLKKNDGEIEDSFCKVNGKGKYKFDEKNELMLKVMDGDTIEIFDTKYNENAKIKVVGISKNIMEPKLNDILTINEGIKTLLEVKIK